MIASKFLSSALINNQTLVNGIYENDPDTTAEQTLDPAILGHRFWQAAREEAKSVETQFDHRPHARFMPPTCLKAGIGNPPVLMKIGSLTSNRITERGCGV